jgi:acid stress chaperone HdeA
MKARQIALSVAAAALLTGSALASADSSSTRKPLRQMTCSDFLLLDDAGKPEIVYWAATRGRDGRAGGAVIDVDATDSMVPALVEQCKEAPTAPFWQKVRAEAGKLGKKL